MSAEPSSGGIGKQVEQAEEQVHEREREQDLDAERQVVEPKNGGTELGSNSARAASADTSISRKFVVGPGEAHVERCCDAGRASAPGSPAPVSPTRAPGRRATRPWPGG